MASDRSVAMDDAEIDAFLEGGGTGVLSLASDDEPYATPVSYAFDPASRRFYLRLGFHAESEKRAFVGPSARARLVVYVRADDTWTSVVAAGTLEALADEEIDADVARPLRRGDVPLLSIWDRPLDEVEFRLYRLVPDRLTGRRAPNVTPS